MREDVGRQFDPFLFAEFDAMMSTPLAADASVSTGRHLMLLA
jgi:hypothetical protein